MKGLKCSVSKLKYIVMSGSMTECLLRRGVCNYGRLKCSVFIVWEHD